MTVLICATAIMAFAIADVASVSRLLSDARQYYAAGAATFLITAPGSLSGTWCDALSDVDGVEDAGALGESTETATFDSLPGTRVPVFSATPGAVRWLGADAKYPLAGVLLSSALASDLGVSPGARVRLNGGNVRVAAVFDIPDDGRDQSLAYSMVEPVDARSRPFDSCVMATRPYEPDLSQLLRATLSGSGIDESTIRIDQFNTRPGTVLASISGYWARSTRWAPLVVAVVGLLLAALTTRARRLEVASAMHAGVPRIAMTGQFALEAGMLGVVSAALASPLLLWPAAREAPAPAIFMCVAACATTGLVLGAIAGVMTVRESSILAYGKDL